MDTVEEKIPDDREIDFCTLGMFIIGKTFLRYFFSSYLA